MLNVRGITVLAVVAACWGLAACGPDGPGFAGGGGRYALSPQAQYEAEEAERASSNHYRWPHPDRAVGYKKGAQKRQPQPMTKDASITPVSID